MHIHGVNKTLTNSSKPLFLLLARPFPSRESFFSAKRVGVYAVKQGDLGVEKNRHSKNVHSALRPWPRALRLRNFATHMRVGTSYMADEVERKPEDWDSAELVTLCKVMSPKWPPRIIFAGACHGIAINYDHG